MMEQMRKDCKDICKGFKEYNEDRRIIHARMQDLKSLNENENFFNGEKALYDQNCKELNLALDQFINYKIPIDNDNLQYIIKEGLLYYLSKIQNLPPYEWDLKVMSDIWVERSNELLNDSSVDMILKELLSDIHPVIY